MPMFKVLTIHRHANKSTVEDMNALQLHDPANVGGRIRWLRKEKKMNQQDLAGSVGIKQSTLSDIESLRTNAPTAANLLRIAAALDANPTWIATGSGDPWALEIPPEEGAGELAEIYGNLSPQKRAALLAAARALNTA